MALGCYFVPFLLGSWAGSPQDLSLDLFSSFSSLLLWALPCSSVLNLQIKLLTPTACGPSLPLNVDVQRQTVTSHPGPAPDLQCPQNGDISPWPNKGCRQLGPCKTHSRGWGLCSELVLEGPPGWLVRCQEGTAEWFRQQRGPQEWVRSQGERNRESIQAGAAASHEV